MADIVSPETRSRMMSGIRGKNTRPEVLVRKALHRMGFRFRLHDRRLPGKPDLVFPGRKAVVFVHGCFWHGHDCHLFRMPGTRPEFWRPKIASNIARDEVALHKLHEAGWRVATVWECALKGRTRLPLAEVAGRVGNWLEKSQTDLLIRGAGDGEETGRTA